jgi:hypothetical protein
MGRSVGNIIISPMNGKPNDIFLINCAELKNVNHSTIAILINESLSLLWPNGVKYENVLLLVTDAAPYMKKAYKSLKTFYTKCVHVTCMAHLLHRLCDTIRLQFKNVDKMISNVKKIFKKSPKRINIFKEKYPEIPLPPNPILTRWGTWINASLY